MTARVECDVERRVGNRKQLCKHSNSIFYVRNDLQILFLLTIAHCYMQAKIDVGKELS